jgi:Holliday junction resolvase-like predicted endonuclease
MLHVIKATGKPEPYSEEKLVQSIKRAGIPEPLENQVLSHVKEKLYDDIPTAAIYHHIKEYLKHSEHPYTSAKYSLKQAIMDLGPTGYPFEDYIAHIMQAEGFSTTVRNIVRGSCITHEIDVIATKNQEKVMVEAKFHHFPGTKTNVHVAMYTKARFEDTKQKNGFTAAWLVTNTKVTTDAIAFGGCCGMQILSWEYPAVRNFRDIVEKAKLIPITALLSLNHTQKAQLLQLGVVLVKDIVTNETLLRELHLPKTREEEILHEAKHLLG